MKKLLSQLSYRKGMPASCNWQAVSRFEDAINGSHTPGMGACT
jgi:hypothetical protein